MPGRRPKTATLVEMRRTISPNRSLPGPPDHLSEAGKSCWRVMVKILKEAGLVARTDADALALYCTAYERWQVAEEGLKKHGLLVKMPNGFVTASPLLPIANKAMEQMIKLLTEFGMTPASRCRIPGETEPPRKFNSYRAASRMDDPRRFLEEG